ncbi:MAG: LysM peptidoglycan-binding domain-containing protein, partial [Proteobacteria bacterium]|nr:LysM peptidoglycan-binding domain-containing protein [Pseudomonadota bacterium]
MRKHKAVIIVFVLTIWGLALCSSGFADISAQINEEFIPGEDSGFFYTIKKGDTLWDLSQKFYDSEWDWPGLWKINKDIKNPHWIYPGKKIRIFLKERLSLNPKIVEVKKHPPKPPVEVKPSFSYAEIDHVSFLRKNAQPSLGEIIKEEENNLLMTQNDIVYIKPSGKGTLVPGKEYQIFSTAKIKTQVGNEKFTGIKHLIKAR